jgi:lysine decarboxylase
MPVEMADRDTIVPVVTLADAPGTVARFADILAAVVERHRAAPRPPVPAAAWTITPVQALPPRDAFFSRNETLAADAAVGRVSAELVAPYPPGIPVLAPGEVVTSGALDALRAALAEGSRIAYAADPSLATLQVVSGP